MLRRASLGPGQRQEKGGTGPAMMFFSTGPSIPRFLPDEDGAGRIAARNVHKFGRQRLIARRMVLECGEVELLVTASTYSLARSANPNELDNLISSLLALCCLLGTLNGPVGRRSTPSPSLSLYLLLSRDRSTLPRD